MCLEFSVCDPNDGYLIHRSCAQIVGRETPHKPFTTKVAPVLVSRLPCTSAIGRILFHSLRGFVWYRIDLWEEGHDR